MSFPPPAVPQSKRPRKGFVFGLGLAGAFLILALVVGFALLAGRVRGGTSLGDLRRGECFNTKKAVIDMKANRVDCAEPHTDEVAGVLTYPAPDGADYPGKEGILEFGKHGCVQQEAEFFGGRQRPATTEVFVFGPNEGAWKNGDRAVVCSLREESEAKRTGSYLDA